MFHNEFLCCGFKKDEILCVFRGKHEIGGLYYCGVHCKNAQTEMKAYEEKIKNAEKPETNLCEDECPICMEDITDLSVQKTLSCGHVFHTHCIKQWFVKVNNHNCPMCRRHIDVMPSRFDTTKAYGYMDDTIDKTLRFAQRFVNTDAYVHIRNVIPVFMNIKRTKTTNMTSEEFLAQPFIQDNQVLNVIKTIRGERT
jgi:hypothetical protein